MRSNKDVLYVAVALVALASCTQPSLGAEACEIAPVAVWSPSPTRPADRQTLGNLIDGDWSTVCCFLDDTPTGKDPHTQPPRGATPVTARFVLDLGKTQSVSGLRLRAQRSWVNCMAENVSVFACDDRQGKQNVRLLQDHYALPPVNTFHTALVAWKPCTTRYLGVVVNESYDRRRNGVDWWRGADPRQDRDQWQCNEPLRCQFGWWWGPWQATVAKLPQTVGGPPYEFAGTGTRFTVQIADVSCFCGQPADWPAPNVPAVAFPQDRIERDWMYQDCGVANRTLVANSVSEARADPIGPDISRCFSSPSNAAMERAMVERVLAELRGRGADITRFQQQMAALAVVAGRDPRWRQLYLAACRERRRDRLKALRQWTTQFIYVKHYVFGGWTHLVPTDEVTDEQFFERNPDFHEGSQLCRATILADGSVKHEVLLDRPQGVIRDPNLSDDATTLVFAMRDNFRTDDNHLYTLRLADRTLRQITFSPTVAGRTLPCSDTEPCFAPNGDIVFQSTRCGHLDVCWVHPTSNLYACDRQGRYLRRLAFDQVRTLYPQVLNDGRILYTRWEYSDRNPFFQQSLFVMHADGTGQTAFYGNNSEYPAALIHARAVPGSNKVIAVVGGHHVLQKGKLALIDRARGADGNSGIEYVAGAAPDGRPGRQPSNIHSAFDRWPYDLFGQVGPQWQYPYAFDESHYLVAFLPEGSHFLKGPFTVPFGVYWMTADGERELLAFDWGNSCGQAIPVLTRRRPAVKPSLVDWRQSFGRFYVQNVYQGPGLAGVRPGTIQRLRVVALEYRAAGVSKNLNRGSAGDSHINTPVAIENGSQDVKHVLGEVDVEADGSAYFEVPARTPVFFQLLDARGRCVQTMRSWTMVQPGERAGCVGCHEDKRQTGLAAARTSLAATRPVRRLEPLPGQTPHPLLGRLEQGGLLASVENFLGVNRPCVLDPQAPVDGFSYAQRVQPIWDRHCVGCHGGAGVAGDGRRSTLRLTGERASQAAIGLRDFTQSYLALTANGQCTPLVNWVHPESMAAMLPPAVCGSTQSKLLDYLEPTHYQVRLTDAERRTVACWIDLSVPFCGSYAEANTWNRQEPRRGWQIETNTWNRPQAELYDYFQQKRVLFAQQELEQIKAWLVQRAGR